MRATAERRFAQVRVELDGRPVQVRRLDIGHDLLQVGGGNLKNLLLERDGRNRRGLILRDHTVAGGEVVQLLLTLQLLTLCGQLTLGLLQLVALLVQLLLAFCQLILLGGDFRAARIDLLLTLGEGITLLIEGILLFGQLRLLGVELIHHLVG
ncbi:Uncharacterised protein [Mycobacterium tuberculosis]|nr:Uncharacterised protein [Mycobacterium tuberculosis]